MPPVKRSFHPRPSQIRFIRTSLDKLVETLFRNKQIDRSTRRTYEQQLKNRKYLRGLANDLYGPDGEASVGGDPPARLVLLSLKEINGGKFDLLVFRSRKTTPKRKPVIRCLVGHRFSQEIMDRFRWNLRELFGPFGIDEVYSGFDGRMVNIIEDLRNKIQASDFCLFDNKDTSEPSRPNVYIEAGMAFAFNKPFIFCHHNKKEVWPSNFSSMTYIPYGSYKELFSELYAKLPVFLENHVEKYQQRTD